MARPLIEKLDRLCYKTFIGLITIVAFICGYLLSWTSCLWSISCFIRLQFKEGFLGLLIFLLSIVIWRGSLKLSEKLEEHNKWKGSRRLLSKLEEYNNWIGGFPTEEEFELYKDDLMKIDEKYQGEEALIKLEEFIWKKRGEKNTKQFKRLNKILNDFRRLNKGRIKGSGLEL